MNTYQITFTIKTTEEDASPIMEAAEQTVDELIAYLEANNVKATHDEDSGMSPSVEQVKA